MTIGGADEVSCTFFSAHFPLVNFLKELFGGELFTTFVHDDAYGVRASLVEAFGDILAGAVFDVF